MYKEIVVFIFLLDMSKDEFMCEVRFVEGRVMLDFVRLWDWRCYFR